MYYAKIKPVDIANGEGCRVSLYVSGCDFHCKGCFNPETWDFWYGRFYTKQTEIEIMQLLKPDYIRGLSILGGEPLHHYNLHDVDMLITSAKYIYPDKTVWLYTGFKYEDLDNAQLGTIEQVDVLVDGQFKEENKMIDGRFRGSSNQRIIDVKKTLEAGEIVLWEDEYGV